MSMSPDPASPKAQLNLHVRHPRHRPPYIEAVVWPYSMSVIGGYDGTAFDRPGQGPGTMRIVVPPPGDDANAVRHFLHVLSFDMARLHELPIPEGYWGWSALDRIAYVIAWLHDRVARANG